MDKRLELHEELLGFSDNIYFQPPNNTQLSYPCVIYQKGGTRNRFSNNKIYQGTQQYTITVIDRDPDSIIADEVEIHFQYCVVTGYYTMDNLNHTSLTLFY